MWSSLKASFKPLMLTLGLGGLVVASYEAIGFVVSVDALKRFRSQNLDQDAPAAEMKQARFTAYNQDRMVTEGQVARLTFTKHREAAMLEGISDGKFYNESGEVYNYTALSAKYLYARRHLEIHDGGRVWGRDIDIKAPAIHLDRPLQQVEAPGEFSGLLSGGQVKARNLFYNLRDQSWQSGPVEWTGVLSLQEQGGDRRRWNVKGESVASSGGVMTYTKGRAEDGEVIVMADKIVHTRSTDVIVATGNVRYYGVDANLTCPKATIFQRERRAVFEGGVNMLVKPKGSTKPEEAEIPPLTPFVPEEIKAGRPLPPNEQRSANDQLRDTENLRKYPTSVIAQKVEYWYKKGSRRAIITGAPQARQEINGIGWRMVWGKSAEWDGEKDQLRVKSGENAKDARLKMSNGDDFKAVWFLISTIEDSDSWEAKDAEGVFEVDDETTGGGTTGGGTTGSPPPISGPIGR